MIASNRIDRCLDCQKEFRQGCMSSALCPTCRYARWKAAQDTPAGASSVTADREFLDYLQNKTTAVSDAGFWVLQDDLRRLIALAERAVDAEEKLTVPKPRLDPYRGWNYLHD